MMQHIFARLSRSDLLQSSTLLANFPVTEAPCIDGDLESKARQLAPNMQPLPHGLAQPGPHPHETLALGRDLGLLAQFVKSQQGCNMYGEKHKY